MSYVGNIPTTAAFPFDQFSGNGSTTAFTLSYAPAGSTSIIVSISGVVQNPNTYSVSGTTLTFTPAPPTGTNNIAVLYLGLPVVAATSPGNTAYFSSSVFTATAGQTVFTPSGTYQVGFLNVIRNGSQLAPADYTATNGTTVTLASACTAGDTVVIEVFNLTSLTGALPLTGGALTGAFSAPTISASTSITAPTVATSTGNLYPLVLGTAVTASGTSVDFTGIPSTAKRVTVMFQNVSTNGTSFYVARIGNTTVTATGYVSTLTYTNTSPNSSVGGTDTTGFLLTRDTSAGSVFTGIMTICLLSNFVYVASFNAASSGSTFTGSGFLNLGSALDRVRITTLNGTDTFDSGTINIMWE